MKQISSNPFPASQKPHHSEGKGALDFTLLDSLVRSQAARCRVEEGNDEALSAIMEECRPLQACFQGHSGPVPS